MMEKDPENFEQNIKPISELRSYNKLLEEVSPQNPVILTKNGYGKYVIADLNEFEKYKKLAAASELMRMVEKARQGETYSMDDVKERILGK